MDNTFIREMPVPQDGAAASFIIDGRSSGHDSNDPRRQDPDSWQYWAALITGTWQSSVANIIETGKQLNEAKARLTRDEFGELIQKFLPFKRRTAQRLMKLARNPVLSNASHVTLLPAHYATLAALDTLDLPPTELTAKINNGTINARMERKDVAKLKPPNPNAAPRKSAVADLKQANIEQARLILDLQSDLAHAKRNDGSLFSKGDNDELIARILIETLGERKAREVAKVVLGQDKPKIKAAG
jgi:Protein of unknown function (DUF3102)